ncbi:DUF302 domain-containing protein [Thermoplasma acidophilum]|uniref:DUF302 domain-containing protein n=1 Tax=Thermoplasma acidophilum TaxID=2303 RepID=UPI001389F861|nr:DUF302 domain-containing protein [Thermoplasma acidophilum]
METVDLESRFSFEETVSNLRNAIRKRNLTEFAIFDHRLNAEKAGLKMNSCTVFVFGNPAIGTYIMQEDPAVGLDLPSKILVYEKGDAVHVRFRKIDDTFNEERSREAARKLNFVVESMAREIAGLQP